jgi:hypothetical protein
LGPTYSPFANPNTAMATKAQPPTAAKATRNRTARRVDPASFDRTFLSQPRVWRIRADSAAASAVIDDARRPTPRRRR